MEPTTNTAAAPKNPTWPGRYGLYGVKKVCQVCGTTYKGPRWSARCWPCEGKRA